MTPKSQTCYLTFAHNKPVAKDPTATLPRRMNTLLLSLKRSDHISEQLYSRLRCSAGYILLLYALPKLHNQTPPQTNSIIRIYKLYTLGHRPSHCLQYLGHKKNINYFLGLSPKWLPIQVPTPTRHTTNLPPLKTPPGPPSPPQYRA